MVRYHTCEHLTQQLLAVSCLPFPQFSKVTPTLGPTHVSCESVEASCIHTGTVHLALWGELSVARWAEGVRFRPAAAAQCQQLLHSGMQGHLVSVLSVCRPCHCALTVDWWRLKCELCCVGQAWWSSRGDADRGHQGVGAYIRKLRLCRFGCVRS